MGRAQRPPYDRLARRRIRRGAVSLTPAATTVLAEDRTFKRTAMATDAPPAIEIRGSHEALSQHARVGRRRPDNHAGRNPRPRRRERRRQIDAHQNSRGTLSARLRRDSRERAPGSSPYRKSCRSSFVHQDLGLVDELSIGENVALVAGFPRSGGLISWSKVWRQAEQIYGAHGARSAGPARSRGFAERRGQSHPRHRAGAVARRPRSSSSTSRPLLCPDLMRCICSRFCGGCAPSGTSILYVSHRLNELFGLVDRVTVLRDGRLVRSSDIGETTPESIVRDMLGRDLELHHQSAASSGRRRAAAAGRGPCRRRSGAADLQCRSGRGCRPRWPARRGPRGDRPDDLRRPPASRRNDQARLGPRASGHADQRAHRKRHRAPGGRPTRRERAQRHVAARESVSQREQRGRRPFHADRRTARGARSKRRAGAVRRAPAQPGGAHRLAERRQSAEGLRRPLASDRRAAFHHGRADRGRRHWREGGHPPYAARHRGRGRRSSRRLFGFRRGRDLVRPCACDRSGHDHGGSRRTGAYRGKLC